MARSSRPTIYTVAAEAGVSISTVSLAINHPHRVSPSTRQQVMEAAERIGYRPPARVEPGPGGRLVTIAVAAPFSSWPSYALRLGGLLQRLRDTGTDVMVHDLPATNLTTAPVLDALPLRSGVDAVVVMGAPLTDEVERRLLDAGIPCVLVDASSRRLPSVVTDDEHGGALLGEHLAGLGHTKIAFVHDQQLSADYVSAGMLRSNGLIAGARQVNPAVEFEAFPLADGAEGARETVRLVQRADCTAVVANHDDNAARVLGAMRSLGLSAPDDLAVTGYDGATMAEALGLTTVVQPFADSGRMAAEMVLATLAGDGATLRTLTLSGRLETRSSTLGTLGAVRPAAARSPR